MADTSVRTLERHEEWMSSIESVRNYLLRNLLNPLVLLLRTEKSASIDYVRLANTLIDEPARILELQLELIEEIRRRSTFFSSSSARLTAYMVMRSEEPMFWESPSRPSAQRASERES